MAMPAFLRNTGRINRLSSIGGVSKELYRVNRLVGSGPVDDACGQTLEGLVPQVAIVTAVAGVASDEQRCRRCTTVVRSQPDPEVAVPKADVNHAATRCPSFPLRRMALARLNQAHDLWRKRDLQRAKYVRFVSTNLRLREGLRHVGPPTRSPNQPTMPP